MSLKSRKILRALISISFIALSVLMYIFVLSRGELL
jgi:hypothetical protein